MAETGRVPSALSPPPRRSAPRPRLPHPTSHPISCERPLRLPLDETQNLRPPVWEEETLPPLPADPAEPRPATAPRIARPIASAAPPRTRTERAILAVLVLGLALNALALLRNSALSRADVLLGATVLLAGTALLVLMEVYRRTGR
jgi:hypothetical protein